MQVELHCAACRFCFPIELDMAALDRITDEGPWSALGDGETFEDRIHADLLAHHEAECPHCGNPVAPTEESLGDLASELLAQW
jgi:hypothetical protein